MKLNISFFSKAILIMTLLISPKLSAQAEEIANYTQDQSSKSYSQVLVAAAGAEKHGHGSKSIDHGFISKRTTAMEFTFALVAVIGGLIFSERYQRNQEKQQMASEGDNLAEFEEQLEHQDLTEVSRSRL